MSIPLEISLVGWVVFHFITAGLSILACATFAGKAGKAMDEGMRPRARHPAQYVFLSIFSGLFALYSLATLVTCGIKMSTKLVGG